MKIYTLQSMYGEVAPRVGHETFMAALTQLDGLITKLTEHVNAGNEWAKANGYPEVEDYPQYRRVRLVGK